MASGADLVPDNLVVPSDQNDLSTFRYIIITIVILHLLFLAGMGWVVQQELTRRRVALNSNVCFGMVSIA